MRLWIRVALVATLCLSLVGLVPAIRIIYRMEVPKHVEIGEVARFTALEFPAGAALLHSALQEGTDWSIRAVVKVRRADMGKFLASGKQAYSLDEGTAFRTTEKSSGHPAWWTPYKARRFRDFSGVSRIRGFKAQARIRIATDDPRYAVVHLDWTGKPYMYP